MERLFLVPGNHDIDRSVSPGAWSSLRGCAAQVSGLALSRWWAGGDAPLGVSANWREEVLRRQAAYRTWVATTLDRGALLPAASGHGRLGYRATVRLPGHPFDVHVIGLDSAWLCGDDHDADKLRLTEDQVMRLAGDRRGDPLPGFRLALVHHPPAQLADAGTCVPLLAERVDLLLGGEELPVYEKLGDVRSRAVTLGQIADVLQARGELDEALRIRREEVLPVIEKLGDVRSRAVTLGQIADVLQARGELDEALRIRREEELPVFEKLGDVRSRAITLGKIADILQARGELDEALRIRREEQLPVYEKLGDVRARAITLGKIADVLQARGELDEALRIRREEVLPVFEKLGLKRDLLVGRTNLALLLIRRGNAADPEEARTLLDLALKEAVSLRIPEADQIRLIQQRLGS